MQYFSVSSNFCERRLFPSQPEYINAFSALYISYIGLRNLIRRRNIRLGPINSSIYWCIFTNGLCSFAYHWNAWYIFKLADEFSMIIPVWFGLLEITHMLNYPPIVIGLITLYNICMLAMGTFIWFEPYFPMAFAVELLLLIPLYKDCLYIRSDPSLIGLKGILISSVSGLCWFITERNCSIYLIWGHAVWHIGMSTGLSYLINYFANN